MNLNPDWQEIGLRLAFTMIAGALIGYNREAGGHAAGLRTTILVALAASIAMVLANLLLSVTGKVSDSFATMDVMRMALGILTGVGFIGGGAILKRGNAISGVTTAATLWIATAIGLCFGAGQLALGAAGTGLALLTLWAMKWVDLRVPRERRAMLMLRISAGDPPPELDALIRRSGCRARFRRHASRPGDGEDEVGFEIIWREARLERPPAFLDELRKTHNVLSFDMISEEDH